MGFFSRDRILSTKIQNHEAVICVIGLGYVGLPMAVRFARAGFRTLGIDISAAQVAAIELGVSPIDDVSTDTLGQVTHRLKFHTIDRDFSETPKPIRDKISEADVFIVCVPTPLKHGPKVLPDEEALERAGQVVQLSRNPKDPHSRLVVVESTTYPGCTDKIFTTENGLFEGVHVAYSPERINPGGDWAFEEIDKVLGAGDDTARDLARMLYEPLFVKVGERDPGELVEIKSTSAGEAIKCAENGWRLVSIGFAQELARMAPGLGVDVWQLVATVRGLRPRADLRVLLTEGSGSSAELSPKEMAKMARSLKDTPRFQAPMPGQNTIRDLANLSLQAALRPAEERCNIDELAKVTADYYEVLCRVFMYELSYYCAATRGRVAFLDVYRGILSKPFGLGFCEPGPGAGGHCIPVDPMYLTYEAGMMGVRLHLIEEAMAINERMPLRILNMISKSIRRRNGTLRGAKVLVLGVTYKPDVADLRESKAIELMRLLVAGGAEVCYCDPVYSKRRKEIFRRKGDERLRRVCLAMPTRPQPGGEMAEVSYYPVEIDIEELSSSEEVAKQAFDCAVLVTDHEAFRARNFRTTLLGVSTLAIVDTRNVFDPEGARAAQDRLSVLGRC